MLHLPNQGPTVMYNADPPVVGASQSVVPQRDGQLAIFITGGVPLQLYLATILLGSSISGQSGSKFASDEPTLCVRDALVLANQLISEHSEMQSVKDQS